MRIPAKSADAEALIQARSAEEGGPFRTLTCARCRTRSGALRNRRGEWMTYPLEGSEEPSFLEQIVPVKSREHLLRARAWWLRHADDVERFRRARAGAGDDDESAAAPQDDAPRARASPPPSPRHEILGLASGATLADVRRAWRAAVKRWHPDRIPSQDPVVVEEAHRRFGEIRVAYESLVAEMTRRSR
jgi:hypothetical protein